MAFLDELRKREGDTVAEQKLLDRWLKKKPRALYRELRPARPILAIGNRMVVTKYHDVVEVLGRDGDFGVEAYTARMGRATGAFVLGMADGEAYEREASVLRLACPRSDLPGLEKRLELWAEEAVAPHRATGRMELMEAVARRVPARLVAEYFGVCDTDKAELLGWLRALFHDIFLNPTDHQEVAAHGLAAAKALTAHLDGLIACALKTPPTGEAAETVLSRCVRLHGSPGLALGNDGIRRNLAGLIVGATETMAESVANVIDFLLSKPKLLARAAAVADGPEPAALGPWVWEALRFRPQSPLLLRHARTEAWLARGTPRATRVPAGTVLVVALESAMHDPDEVDQPEKFDPTRPERHYLHFGAGMHRCLGRHLSALALPILVRAILRLPGLRRAAGTEGRIAREGPFPDRLTITFDPHTKTV